MFSANDGFSISQPDVSLYFSSEISISVPESYQVQPGSGVNAPGNQWQDIRSISPPRNNRNDLSVRRLVIPRVRCVCWTHHCAVGCQPDNDPIQIAPPLSADVPRDWSTAGALRLGGGTAGPESPRGSQCAPLCRSSRRPILTVFWRM
jgi:hypothetical protein